MRDNDRQLGKPMRVYRDTKANIEALGHRLEVFRDLHQEIERAEKVKPKKGDK